MRPMCFLQIESHDYAIFQNGKSHHNPYGCMEHGIDRLVWKTPSLQDENPPLRWNGGGSKIIPKKIPRPGHALLPPNSQGCLVPASKWSIPTSFRKETNDSSRHAKPTVTTHHNWHQWKFGCDLQDAGHTRTRKQIELWAEIDAATQNFS